MTSKRLATTRTRRGAFLIMVLAALALAFLAAPQFAHVQNPAVTVQWTAATKTIDASWSDPGACDAPSRYVIYYAFSGTNVKIGDVAATEASFSKSVSSAATDFSIKVYCGNATATPNGRLLGEVPLDLATSGTYQSRSVDADLNGLNAAGNGSSTGIWSDGITIWVADDADNKIYAYALSGGTRQDGTGSTTNLEFDLHAANSNARGLWSDGATMWVVNDASGASAQGKVFSYRFPKPSLSIADAFATAGSGITFTITLSEASTQEVTVDYATSVESTDTATEDTDYTAASDTLTFAADETTKTITVQTASDSEAESAKTFTVTLSNASSNATISDAAATGTIVPPSIVTAYIDNSNLLVRWKDNDPGGCTNDNYKVYVKSAVSSSWGEYLSLVNTNYTPTISALMVPSGWDSRDFTFALLLFSFDVEVWCGARTSGRKLGGAHAPTAAGRVGNVALSGAMLTPGFNEYILDYDATVPADATSTTVTFSDKDSSASVSYLDSGGSALSDADGNTEGFQVDLGTGETVFSVKVSAAFHGSSTYTFRVTKRSIVRAYVDVNNILVRWKDNDPGGCESDNYKVYLTRADTHNWNEHLSAVNASYTPTNSALMVPSGWGSRDFTFFIIPFDQDVEVWCGARTSGRKLGEAYAPHDRGRLSNVALSGATLPPGFNTYIADYAATVPHDATSTTVTFTGKHMTATVSYLDSGGSALSDADGTTPGFQVNLGTDETVFSVKVSHNTLGSSTYTFTVTKLPPPSIVRAYIRGENLLVRWKDNDPGGCTNDNYKVYSRQHGGNWGEHLSAVNLNYMPTNSALMVPSGWGSRDFTFSLVILSFDVEVWCGARTSGRKLGGDTAAHAKGRLLNVALSGATLTPRYSEWVLDYAATVPADATSTTVTFSGKDSSATVSYLDSTGGALPDADGGTAGFQVDLGTDETVFSVKTSTSNYGSSTYTFTVTKQAPTLSIVDASAGEGDSLEFTVTLNAASAEEVTVDYATSVESTDTATEDTDYTAASGTLTFSPGEKSKTITVQTNSDSVADDGETFTVTLSNASSNVTISDATATGTITGAPTTTLLTATSNAVADGVDEEDEVTLGIEDAAGVTVVWSQDGGNPQTVAFVDSANNAVLTGGAARVVKFTAPNRVANEDYGFTVTATKGGVSATRDITITVRADDDAPVVSSTVQELEILFPRGPADQLDGPLATDPEGKSLTYTFQFERESAFVPAVDSLLSVQAQGDDYLIGPQADAATPDDFLSAYANLGVSSSYQTFATAVASDGTNESNYQFAVSVLYEASAQFSAPAAFESNQRWSRSAAIEMFEGDRADPAAAFAWTAVRSGARTWGTGTPSGAMVVKCEALGTSTEYSPGWPAAGTADSGRFTVTSPADAIMGDGRLGFAGALDYESPSDAGTDNTYHVRVYNHHLLKVVAEGVASLGCTGSALDLKVRIKDAGVPTAVRGLMADRKTGDNTTLELSWTAPEGFIDPSDNSVVPSTRGGPAVSDHDYRYRVQGTTTWTEVTDTEIPGAEASISGLAADSAYEVEVRAKNSEGASAWSLVEASAASPADTTAPQPTIMLVASTAGAEDFKLLISFGEAVTGFTKSDIVLNDAWLIEAAAMLTEDSTTPGDYSVPIVPSPNVAGLTVPLNVTIAAGAVQDTATPANDSLAGELALESVYTGPATFISQVDPADADGEFDIEVYFLDQISGRPVTGFEADDMVVDNGSVKADTFRKVPLRYDHDNDFQGASTGHFLFEATITPGAGCDTLPCTVTVDVARGAATSATFTQEYWAHIHSGWTVVDGGHTPRPNFKANTLTVQREATGTNLYVRALALYRDRNNFAYRASFLMNEENQTLRATHFAADNATLELIDAAEPRLLWEFWVEVAADGNVKLKADSDLDGDYDADDYTYTIFSAKKTLPAPRTARSAGGGKTAKSRTAEAAQRWRFPTPPSGPSWRRCGASRPATPSPPPTWPRWSPSTCGTAASPPSTASSTPST